MNPLLIRRRGMMMAASQSHVRLQYLTTTGAQMVITDIVIPAQTTVVKVVTEIKDGSGLSTSRLIVSSYKSGENSAYQFYANGNSFFQGFAYIAKNTSSFYTLTATRNPNTNKDIINGVSANTNGRNHGGQCIVLSAFANYTYFSNYQYTKYIDVYFDDVLVADFVPVRIGTIAQWYDQLNHKYWRSDTGTDYVAGPDVI